MFNLSDKELDRLSREAASQHDPGDQIMGPGAWERLEARLDKELGGASTPSPNPSRGIRRLPFQYVPVILLIVGVSYYAVRQFSKPKKTEGSGSPPLSVVRSDQAPAGQTPTETLTKSPANSKNSTPTPSKSTTAQYPDSNDPAQTTAGAAGAGGGSGDANTAAGNATPAPTGASAVASGSNSPANAGSRTSGSVSRPETGNGRSGLIPTAGNERPGLVPTAGNERPGIVTTARNGRSGLATGTRTGTGKDHSGADIARTRNGASTAETAGTHTGDARRGGHHGRGDRQDPSTVGQTPDITRDKRTGRGHSNDNTNPDLTDAAHTGNQPDKTAPAPAAERGAVTIRGPRSLTSRPVINDSSLRAYTPPPAPPATPGRSLHINRSLQFGLQLAPDFSSVNSLAGDKPGSSIGITLDYQLVNRLYLGTGILFSKKNYTARIQDYHLPYDYFRQNNLPKVDFVKGSMNMLEIPLNLRYDFSVTGNTLFFASAGVSSYLMLNQRSDYYFNFFNRAASRRFNYPEKNVYLLSAVNLSLGVETGISNSLSLMVAPYVKVPARSIGFGEIKMNSVGINFALKFAPVISRKRK